MPNGYVTAAVAEEILGRSRALVTLYCRQGRIKGAEKFGMEWMIPEKALKAFKREMDDYKPGNPEWQKKEKGRR